MLTTLSQAMPPTTTRASCIILQGMRTIQTLRRMKTSWATANISLPVTSSKFWMCTSVLSCRPGLTLLPATLRITATGQTRENSLGQSRLGALPARTLAQMLQQRVPTTCMLRQAEVAIPQKQPSTRARPLIPLRATL